MPFVGKIAGALSLLEHILETYTELRQALSAA